MVKDIGFQFATTPKLVIYGNFKIGLKIIQYKTLQTKNVEFHL